MPNPTPKELAEMRAYCDAYAAFLQMPWPKSMHPEEKFRLRFRTDLPRCITALEAAQEERDRWERKFNSCVEARLQALKMHQRIKMDLMTEIATLKARVEVLEKFVANLYPDVIHMPDCDVLHEDTGATCTCGGQARIDALLPKEGGRRDENTN